MTRSEARKIIKTHAPTKYSRSTEMLLLRLVDLNYRGENNPDTVDREIKTTTISLCRAARVQGRQLARMVRQLAEDGVLLDVVCGVHHVTCRLNLEPLTKLEDYGEKHKEEKKRQDQARSAKARERRAELRELGR